VGRTGLAGAVAAGATAFALSLQWRKGPAAAEVDVASLEKRVAALEVEAGGAKHSAFVFVKPHAVYDPVKDLVSKRLAELGITVLSEGAIPAEKIDTKQLIDTHYGAIAAKAVKLKPDTLTVQPKAQEAFEKAFGMSWTDALSKGLVFNAMDAAAKLGITTGELGDKWGTLKKDVNLLKFGGGFYCGKVGDIYVINGFYMEMRSKFTLPGTCIYYYEVEWNPSVLSWEEFRVKVLGTTDPKTALAGSLRNTIYVNWKDLGLQSCPNTGDNGVHASASPFEALAERNNWLGVPLTADYFGRAMLAVGVPLPMLTSWCDDPPVKFDGKKQSLFDLLEDMDGKPCLQKSGKIAAANA
jgi:nucleoside diphosphate kinase